MSFFLACFVNLYYKALQSFLFSFYFCICNLCISLYHCKLDYENKDIYNNMCVYINKNKSQLRKECLK